MSRSGDRRFSAGNRPARGGGCQSPSSRPTSSLQPRPIDPAGHAQDRAVGAIVAGEKVADLVDRRSLRNAGMLALARPAPGLGIVAAAELDHHLLRRLVLDRPQLPGTPPPAGFQLIGRQVRPAEQVGVDRQRGRQIFGQRRPAEAGVGVGDRLAPLDAQVVQVERRTAGCRAGRPRAAPSRR